MNSPVSHRTCVRGLAVLGIITAAANAEAPPPKEQPRRQDPATLEMAAEGAGSPQTVVLPPPGRYQVSKGDVLVLQGRRKGEPDCPPVWSGDVTGGPSFTVPVVMDGAKRITAAFNGDCAAAGIQDSFAAPDAGALHAFLGSGGLYGWFSVDRATTGYGAGITHMVSGDYPYAPVFMRPDLNFEHILNGHAADAWRAQNTPRTDPMELRLLSPSCVEIRWPARTSAWKLDCVMRYAFSGQNAMDMEFEVTPRADEAPQGYLVFMWASYMHAARTRVIHFPGVRGGVDGWIEFGGGPARGGAIDGVGQAGLKWEKGADALNLGSRSDIHFREPVYYGLLDGDQDWQTADDTMAFIMMFDRPQDTRFAVWNWGDDPHTSAWDWQYVVRSPEVGKTYRHRARMVCKKFQGQDDVMEEYRSWSRTAYAVKDVEAVPLRSFPTFWSPGEDGYNPVVIAGKAVQSDPARALEGYRRLMGSSLHQTSAAEHIDAMFDKIGSPAGLAVEWEFIAAQDGPCLPAWNHLGRARLGMGEIEKAAAAFQRGLDQDPSDRECRLGMGTAEVFQGGVDAGVALLDAVVREEPGWAHRAAAVCAGAADVRAKAGELEPAVRLYARAAGFRPDESQFRIRFGGLLQSMRNSAGALEQYRAVIGMNPDSESVAQSMDAIYTGQGDAAGRVKEWQAVAAMHPDACVPRLHLGTALEAAGDMDAALSAYGPPSAAGCGGALLRKASLLAGRGNVAGGCAMIDQAVAEDSSLAEQACTALADAARSRMRAGDPAAAAELYRKAIVCQPQEPGHRVHLAEALEKLGDGGAALEQYRLVMDSIPDSPNLSARMDALLEQRGDKAGRLEEWRRLADAHPEVSDLRLRLGMALEDAGDAGGAETSFSMALQRDSGNAAAKIRLGALLAGRGDMDGGLGLMDEAVTAHPDIGGLAADTCSMAAKVRLQAGDAAGAAAVLKRARTYSPYDQYLCVALGEALATAGETAGAETAYKEALQRDSGCVAAKAGLGALLAARGELEEGLRLMNEAVAADAGTRGAAAKGCAAAARTLLEQGQALRAVSALEHARTYSPSNLTYRVALGEALEAAGDSSAALGEYRAVVEGVPESPKSSARIDAILEKLGDKDARVKEWTDLAARHPGAATPQLHLGAALEASGDLAGAEAAYRRALSLNGALVADGPLFDRIKNLGPGKP